MKGKYEIQNSSVVVDYLPNGIDLITDPTIQGAVAGEDGKLSVYTFVGWHDRKERL